MTFAGDDGDGDDDDVDALAPGFSFGSRRGEDFGEATWLSPDPHQPGCLGYGLWT